MLESSKRWKYLLFFLVAVLTCSTVSMAVELSQQLVRSSSSMDVYQNLGTLSLLPSAYGAGVLSNVFVIPSNNIFSTTSYYTVAFNTATTGIIKSIEMTFPAGFNVASSKLIGIQGLGPGSLSGTGQVLKYTVTTPISIPAPRPIQIMIGNIINSAAAANQVAIVTKDNSINAATIDGPTSSAVFNLIQVTNPMLGNSAVISTKLGTDSVDSTKIKDGQIGLADMALNSINSGKIINGSIAQGDVSTAFIKKVSLKPSIIWGVYYGWNPDSFKQKFVILDSAVLPTSVVQISLDRVVTSPSEKQTCSVSVVSSGTFSIWCDSSPDPGISLNYVVIN